jgi:hypothetical protein
VKKGARTGGRSWPRTAGGRRTRRTRLALVYETVRAYENGQHRSLRGSANSVAF